MNKANWSIQIQTARKSKGITQRELAKKIGVTETAIKQYENSINLPSYETVLKICEVLDTTWESLFKYELMHNDSNIISNLFEKGVQEINTIIAEQNGLEMQQMGYTGIWYVDNVYKLFLFNENEILSSDSFPILEVLNYSLKIKKELHQKYKEKMLNFLIGKLKHKEKTNQWLIDALEDDKNFREKLKGISPSKVNEIFDKLVKSVLRKKKPD